MTKKIIGQEQLNIDTGLKEVFAVTEEAVVSSINITNLFESETVTNVYIVPNGESLSSKNTLISKVKVQALETYVIQQGVTMGPGDKMYVEFGGAPEVQSSLTSSKTLKLILAKKTDTTASILYVDTESNLKLSNITLPTLSEQSTTILASDVQSDSISLNVSADFFGFVNSSNEVKMGSVTGVVLNDDIAVNTDFQTQTATDVSEALTVRLNDSTVIAAFENDTVGNTIYTSVGTIQGDGTILWGPLQNPITQNPQLENFRLQKLDDTRIMIQARTIGTTVLPADNLLSIVGIVGGSTIGFGTVVNVVDFSGDSFTVTGRMAYSAKFATNELATIAFFKGSFRRNQYSQSTYPYNPTPQLRARAWNIVASTLATGGTLVSTYPISYDAVDKAISVANLGLTAEDIAANYGMKVLTMNAYNGVDDSNTRPVFTVESVDATTFNITERFVYNMTTYDLSDLAYSKGNLGEFTNGHVIAAIQTNTSGTYNTRLLVFDGKASAEPIQDYGEIPELILYPYFTRLTDNKYMLTGDYASNMYLLTVSDEGLIVSHTKVSTAPSTWLTRGGPAINVDANGEQAVVHEETSLQTNTYGYIIANKLVDTTVCSIIASQNQDEGQRYIAACYSDSTAGQITMKVFDTIVNDFVGTAQAINANVSADIKLIRLSDTEMLIAYKDSATANLNCLVATFDGTNAYTFSAETLIAGVIDNFDIKQSATDKVVVGFAKDEIGSFNIITIAAGVPSVGTSAQVMTDIGTAISVAVENETNFVMNAKKVDDTNTQQFTYNPTGETYTPVSQSVLVPADGDSIGSITADGKVILSNNSNKITNATADLTKTVRENINVFGDEK